MADTVMSTFDPDEISQRAARLAEELGALARAGRPQERLEALLLTALREERERCAAVAEERAAMWDRTRQNDPAWPAEGRLEARTRYNEAVAIADAIRAGSPTPPLV